MNELKRFLSSSNHISSLELCQWLHKNHSDRIFIKPNTKFYFSELFSHLSNNKSGATEEEWDQIMLLVSIFIIANNPSSSSFINSIPINSKNGFLLSTSSILNYLSSKDLNYNSNFHQLLQQNYSNLFKINISKSKVKNSIYSLSPCYFFQIILTITGVKILEKPYIDDLSNISNEITNLTPTDLNFSTINFVSELFRIVKNSLNRNQTIILPSFLYNVFIHMIYLCRPYPSLCLSIFFFTWFFFVKQANNPKLEELKQLTPIISECFYNSALSKYHELHRSFAWYLSFWFYDHIDQRDHFQRIQVLLMILNGIRTEPRMNIIQHSSVDEGLKKFANSLYIQFAENNRYDLYFVLPSLNSSFEAMIERLNKIHPVKLVASKQSKIQKREISFFEQSGCNSNSPIYDKYIFTHSVEYHYDDEKLFLSEFEKQCRNLDQIQKYSSSIKIAIEQIINELKPSLKCIIEDKAQPNNIKCYIISLLPTVINFMIVASYKQMELSNLNHDYGQFFNLNSKVIKQIKNQHRLLNFSNIYRSYFALFENISEDMDLSFADEIRKCVFENFKERKLTLKFIVNFVNVFRNKESSLFNLVVDKLLSLASSKLDLLLSNDAQDVNNLYQLICFTIRLATFEKVNPTFGRVMKNYQRLIEVSVLSNIKYISHQAVAMRTLSHYLQALYENYEKFDKKSPTNDKIKSVLIKPVSIEEFEATAFLDCVDAVLEVSLHNPTYMNPQSLLPILESAFSSREKALIEKAARICLRIFKNEDPNNWNNLTGSSRRLFKHFFHSCKIISNPSLSAEILELLPRYAPAYLHNPLICENENEIKSLDWELHFDLLPILKAASYHLKYSNDEISNYFMLVSTSFEIVIQIVINYHHYIAPILLQLINMLRLCYGFKSISNKVNNLVSCITPQFGDMFLNCKSNLYILCILNSMGMNRSNSTKSGLDLAVTFFEYCKDKPINHYFLASTLDELFSFFPLSTRLFSILSGFSLFMRYYPDYIKISQIRSFLTQATNVSPLDKSFSLLLDTFLKEYLNKADEKTLHEFVALVYEVICPLSILVRQVLLKRISKLSIPVSINSLDEIVKSTSDDVLLYQKLTVAFFCGIEGDIMNDLNQEWVQNVLNYMASSQSTDGFSRIDRNTRILSLLLSIIKNEPFFYFFIRQNPNFFQKMLEYLCHSIMLQAPFLLKIAKKCFKILSLYNLPEMQEDNHIDHFWKSYTSIVSLWGNHPERIDFYQNLEKIVPEKTPSSLILSLMNEITIYITRSDLDKMKFLPNFVKILQQLAVKKVLRRDSLRNQILNTNFDGQTYFEIYLNNMLILYKHPTIPYRTILKKPTTKFLSMFPHETVDFLVNKITDNSLTNFSMLETLILETKYLSFFTEYLTILNEQQNTSPFSPCLYRILIKVSSCQRFLNVPSLLPVVEQQFKKILNLLNQSSYQNENEYQIASLLTTAITNIFSRGLLLKRAVIATSIFSIPYFINSSIYKKHISVVFNEKQIPLITLMFNQILDQLAKINTVPNQMLHTFFILLPRCLKLLPCIQKEQVDVIINSKLLISDNSIIVETGLKSIRTLLMKYEVGDPKLNEIMDDKQIGDVINDLKNCFQSMSVATIVYSLKLTTRIAELNKLPLMVYEMILQQIFSFNKFFEAPYAQYTFQLIKCRPDFMKKLSSKTICIISYFFHDKFINTREIQRSYPYLLSITNILELLPFSYFVTMCNSIEKALMNVPKSTDIPLDIKEILLFTNRLYLQSEIKPNDQECRLFFRVFFQFLRKVLSVPHQGKYLDLVDTLFIMFNDFDCIQFEDYPIDILNPIQTVTNRIHFAIICNASHVIPDYLVNNRPNLIEQALLFVRNEKKMIRFIFLETLLKLIFQSKAIFSNFSVLIYQIIDKLLAEFTKDNYELLEIFLKFIVSNHYDPGFYQYVESLMLLMNNNQSNTELFSILFKFTLNITQYLPPEIQKNHFYTIYTNTEWTPITKQLYTDSIRGLIDSDLVKLSLKTKMISDFPSLIYGSSRQIDILISTIINFSDRTGIKIEAQLIYLYLLNASISCNSNALKYIEKAESLLSSDFRERLVYLIHHVPIVLWSNDYLIYIIALLTQKVKIWQPLFSFSEKLKKVVTSIATSAFSKLINDDIAIELHLFLKTILKNEQNKLYTSLISTILFIFYENEQYTIPFELVYESTLISGDFEFYRKFFKETDNIPQRFVMPSFYDRFFYGFALKSLNTEQKCAAALTLLNQYSSAEFIYQHCESDKTSYFENIRKANLRFLETRNLKFNEIIQPLLDINRNHDETVYLLEKAMNQKNPMQMIKAINEVKSNAFALFCSCQHSSIYLKEKIITIEIILQNMLSFLQKESLLNPIETEHKYSCLNPSFVTLINNFNCLITNKKQIIKQYQIDDSSPPAVLISPSFSFGLKTVAGITSYGFVALNINQINQLFKIISDNIQSNSMNTHDWKSFASFCFSLFLTNRSFDCFSSAYGAYCSVFTSKEDVPLITRQEASARIVTLIRFAQQMANQDDYRRLIIQSKSIFQRSYAGIWRFWLQQLIDLAQEYWFFEITMGLFCEMSYRSTLYAKKFSTHEIYDILIKKIVQSRNMIQITMMEKLEKSLNDIYQINIEEYHKQSIFYQVIVEAFKLTDEEVSKINLMESRTQKFYLTPFEMKLSTLMRDDIEKIGNFQNWIAELKKMNNGEIDEYIRAFTDSEKPISAHMRNLNLIIDDFNQQLPFIFPVHFDSLEQLSVFRFHKEIDFLHPDLILYYATTSYGSNHTFLLQKSHNEKGVHASVITLSTAFSLFRILIQNTYPSRIRSINLAATYCFEIGERSLLIPLMSTPTSLKYLFEREMLMKQEDWVAKYTDPNTGEITDAGLKSTKTFPDDSLARYHENIMPIKTFIRLRTDLTDSYAADVMVRYIFSAPYPDMYRIIACPQSAEIPVLHMDFDSDQSFLNESKHSTFRLSPTILTGIGKQGIPQLLLSMASVAYAFTTHLDSMRAYIELIVGDEMNSKERTIDEIVRRRSIIENRFISSSPPKMGKDIKEQCLAWADRLLQLIEKARDPFEQPAYTIPWF